VIAVFAAITAALAEQGRSAKFRRFVPPFWRARAETTAEVGAMLAKIERQRQELDRCRSAIEALRSELARVEAASTVKSEFLADMSHELRTPLNAIIGFSEIIRSESFGPVENETYRTYINDINFCAEHLLNIVNDTLDIVRHEVRKVELVEEHVAIDAIVCEACRLIAPQAERGQVTLSWVPPKAELPGLYCDRVRLRQILVNVLSNGVKFTEPGGQVEISVDLSDGLILIIADTGIGIEPEHIPLALSRFGRVPSITAHDRQGTGLGLTLAKALAEQHGGSLLLQSTPQVGTIVRISFPARRVVPRDWGDAAREMQQAV
jgi:signal transduction histidine kinase